MVETQAMELGASRVSLQDDLLLALFRELRARHHDILHDMDEAEEFLVDGEALFLEAVTDPRNPCTAGGTPLQLIYTVESLLAKLRRLGGRFRIAFFEEYGLAWRGFHSAAALRAVLLAHLHRTLPPGTVLIFDRWWPLPSDGTAGGDNCEKRKFEKGPKSPNGKLPGAAEGEQSEGGAAPAAGHKQVEQLLSSMRPAFILGSDLLLQLSPLRAAAHRAAADEERPLSQAAATHATIPLLLSHADVLHSQHLELVAKLSVGFLLHCLRMAPCVFISSLEFEAATPFGFMVGIEGAARLLRLHGSKMLRYISQLAKERLYRGAAAAAAPGGGFSAGAAEEASAAAAPEGAAVQAHDGSCTFAPGNGRSGAGAAAGSPHAAAAVPARATGDEVALEVRALLDASAGDSCPMTPRAAFAASVCRHLLHRGGSADTGAAGQGNNSSRAGHGGSGDGVSMGAGSSSVLAGPADAGPTVWLCELFLLHAVLLDFTPLEHRSLALPYGPFQRLYGIAMAPSAPSPAPALLHQVKRFLRLQVLSLITAAVRSDAWYMGRESVCAGKEPLRAMGGPTVQPGPNPDAGCSQRESKAAAKQADGGAPHPEVGRRQVLPAGLAAALADPYHGILLHALGAALAALRSNLQGRHGALPDSQGDGLSPQQPLSPPPPPLPPPLLGLPRGVVKVWALAREHAGLPPCAASNSTTDSSAAASSVAGPQGPGPSAHLEEREGPSVGLERQLLDRLLHSMPWDEAAAHTAEQLAAGLARSWQGPGSASGHDVPHSSGSGEGNGGDGGDGPAAALDRVAHAALSEAARLPESLRNSPIVAAVRGVQQHGDEAVGTAMPPAAAQASPHLTAVAPPTPGPSTAIASDAAGGKAGGAVPLLLQSVGSGDVGGSGVVCWGPWGRIVRPVLGRRAWAEGGFMEGGVQERFHWHTRQPLEPAYLTQSADRNAERDRLISDVHRAKSPAYLLERFRRWLRRIPMGTLTDMASGQLRELIIARIEKYYVRQKNLEEAATKSLIDSLQGGVTFFRQGAGAGGANAATSVAALAVASALAAASGSSGGGSGGGGASHPTRVSSLSEVQSVAHLEALKADRQGKAALALLLKEERMSMADLKRKLTSSEAGQKEAQQRTLGRHGEALQVGVQRWSQAVLPQILKLGGEAKTDRLVAADGTVQRFKAAASTPPELRAVATALQLQLRLALLREHHRRLSREGEGEGGASGEGRGGAGAVPEPELGHLLPLHAGQRAAGEGAEAGAVRRNAVTASAAALHGAFGKALSSLLQAVGELKQLCRNLRAMWLQPCPSLDDPRVGVPAVAIACSTLGALGFTAAAEKLMREAGWVDRPALSESIKALSARRKMSGQQQEQPSGPKPRQGGGSRGSRADSPANSHKKSAIGKIKSAEKVSSVQDASPAGGGNAQGVAAAGDTCGVHDSLLGMFDKISTSSEPKPLLLGVSPVRFQLRCMGDLLERPAGGRPDPRVGFIPDDWQRRLLDLVDAGASAVVSAPTSSGKTFISSYVVRKVLDAHGGAGRVVMVVPTKVLVLQIRAQMAKDFHDVRNLPPGLVLEGAFTRDFRSNMLNSVVLVTVPQCLEILLLSPAHRSWVVSIKYMIFDEVQSINEHGVGDVWERCLLAASCPLLALSATIGNPNCFTSWLRRVKQLQRQRDEAAAAALGVRPPHAAAYDVHLVVHRERYNDITSSIFMPALDSIVADAPEVLGEDEAVTEPPSSRVRCANDGVAGGASGKAAARQTGKAAAPPLPQPVHYVKPAAASWDAPAVARHVAGGTPSALGAGAGGAGGGGQQRGAVGSTSSTGCAGGGGPAGGGRHGGAGGAGSGGGGGGGGRHGGLLLPLHPLISWDLDRVAHSGSLPPELLLAPGEVLELYDGMVWQAEAMAAAAARSRDATLAAAAGEVQRRLRDLDPERLFHPLDPKPMSGSAPTADSARMPDGVDGGTATGSSLVKRSDVKVWERLLAQEALAWACAEVTQGERWVGPVTASAGAAAADPRVTGARATGGMGLLEGGSGDAGGCGGGRLRGPWLECLKRIQARLGRPFEEHHEAVEVVWGVARGGDTVTSLSFQQNHLPSLVLTLHEQRKLPGIVFSFVRHGIERNAQLLMEHLRRGQAAARRRYAAQLAPAVAAYEAAATAARGKMADQAGQADGMGKKEPAAAAEQLGGPQSRTLLLEGLTFSLQPLRPDPSFSLVPFAHMDDSRLLEAVEELRGDAQVNPSLVDALEYGIGVHHGGLNKRYRQAVETLFRAKILQVVFATGTLALGVHMPCRSVVMAGDSPFLDALNFRQMSGRSGRRGLDTMGHVVFFGIAPHRIHRLRTSPMPRLHGNTLLTPTTTLRLMLLDEHLRGTAAVAASGGGGGGHNEGGGGSEGSGGGNGGGSALAAAAGKPPRGASSAAKAAKAAKAGSSADCAPRAVDLMVKMAVEPFLSARSSDPTPGRAGPAPHPPVLPVGGAGTSSPSAAPAMNGAGAGSGARPTQMGAMLDMCLLHLLRNRLLDPGTGRLRGLSGLASHLFWTEPANLALCRLLHDGVFGRMCGELRGQELKDATVKLLAHLFLRTPLPPNLAHKVRKGCFAGRSSSIVMLPGMRPEAEACIDAYNQEAFSAVVGCVINFVMQQDREREADRAAAGLSGTGAAAPSMAQEDKDLLECTLPLSGLVFAPSRSLTGSPAASCSTLISAASGSRARANGSTGGDGTSPLRADGLDSGVDFTNSGIRAGSTSWSRGSLVWWLGRMRRRVVACSPFAALGGRGDEFLSLSDLLNSAKQCVQLQRSSAPLLELRNRQGLKQPLNAWIYDFYKGRSLKPLIEDNEIREGDVWDMLRSAEGILAAATLALELAEEAAAAAGSTEDDAGEGEGAILDWYDDTSDDTASVERRVEALSSRLLRLQALPPPCPPERSATMVVLLFRIISTEFRQALRSVGA